MSTHRQRDAGAVYDPRQHVAPHCVGAQKEQRAPLFHAEEVDVGVKEPPELVRLTAHEQLHRVHAAVILRVDGAQRLRVAHALQAVDEGPHMHPVVTDPAQPLRRGIPVLEVFPVQRVGRHELAKGRHRVERQDHPTGPDRQPMLAKLPPHQLPLRRRIQGGGLWCILPSFLEQHGRHVYLLRLS